MQAIIRLKGINASFYLPLESLTFLRCLEFFKNRMLRHSAQLNILNGPNFMTTMCNTILVFIAESHKMHISLPSSISKLMKALTSTRCEKKKKTKEETKTQLLLKIFCLSGCATEKKAHAYKCAQSALCTSNDRTTLPHTAGWSKLHHRSPGSCSQCNQSSPTHTNGSNAKNTMCPCVLWTLSNTPFHTGLAFFGEFYVNTQTVLPDATKSTI